MGKTEPLDPISEKFVWGEFSRYYKETFPGRLKILAEIEARNALAVRKEYGDDAPYGLAYREYAVVPVSSSPFMKRHFGFLGEENVLRSIMEWIFREKARHLYYTSCFMTSPPDLDTWWGADLIFDIDADDIPGCKGMTMEEQLAVAAEHLDMLVNDFLINDLGISKDHILVNFSGGRGFHARVSDPKLLPFTDVQRIEVMDYIMGEGIKVDRHMVIHTPERKYDPRSMETDYSLPPLTDPGWPGRISRLLVRFADELSALEEKEQKELWSSVAGKSALRTAVLEAAGKLREKRNVYIKPKTWYGLLYKIISRYQVHLDKNVTKDIHRLIRLPYSLHGGTGLAVEILKPEEISSYYPLESAVPEIFAREDRKVTIVALRKDTCPPNGVSIERGFKGRVPEFAALFFTLRGSARPVPAKA